MRGNLRVLILSDFGYATGGSERVNVELREGLKRRGHDARIFASRAPSAPANAVFEADFSCFGSTGWSRRVLPMANPSAWLNLRHALQAFQPDVVHVRMFLAQLSPLILPLLRGRPALLHLGSYQLACPLGTRILPDGSGCRYPPGVACYRQACVGPVGLLRTAVQQGAWSRWRSLFRLIVANSQAMAQALRDAGLHVDTVIRNGTRIVEPRPPLGDSPIIACAGRLVPAKGVDDLLAAMPLVAERVPGVRLLIVGDGPDRHRIEELVRRSPIREQVALHGHLDPPALNRLLRDAWVQVLPSRFREPSANVLPEAMMRGSAVVATATGGTPEVVQDGMTGFLVPPGNPLALAERLVEVVGNRDLAERMGAAGRKLALAELTTERMTERFEAAYRTLVTAPGPVATG